MQNILELEALATDEFHLRDPHTQMGLSYYLLRSLGEEGGADHQQLLPPIQVLIDKLVETLRHRLAADGDLAALATSLLTEELQRIGWTETQPVKKRGPMEIYRAAGDLARVASKPRMEDVLLALNCFLSTEAFRSGHLTTGTVFRLPISKEHWVCMTPACDMVVREPIEEQVWTRAIYPMRPMVAVRLNSEQHDRALGSAERGHYVFVEVGGDRNSFSVFPKGKDLPSYEFFFLHDAGRTTTAEAHNLPKFRASRVEVDPSIETSANARRFIDTEFEVVGQLRPAYASRLLQITGQHLSRIGVDFIRKPEGQT
jgi:hypothetical protein